MSIKSALDWAKTTGGFVTVLAVAAIGGVGGAVLVTGSHSPAPGSVVVRQVSDTSTPTDTATATVDPTVAPTETATVAPVVAPTTAAAVVEAPAPVESTQAPAPVVATSAPEVIVPKPVAPAPVVVDPSPIVTPAPGAALTPNPQLRSDGGSSWSGPGLNPTPTETAATVGK